MNKQIANVVLFYSAFSKECDICISAIKKSGLPVMFLPLDTSSARESAMNGTNFQIKKVPTLLVAFDDGDVQLFIERPKVLAWVQDIIQKMSQQQPQQPQQYQQPQQPYHEDESSEETIRPKKPKKSKRKVKTIHPPRDDDYVEPVFDNAPPPTHPPSNTKGFLTGAQSKSKPSNASIMEAAAKMMAQRDSAMKGRGNDT